MQNFIYIVTIFKPNNNITEFAASNIESCHTYINSTKEKWASLLYKKIFVHRFFLDKVDDNIELILVEYL